ncbi:uncharacterized protein EV422DRAFT_16722 [Fimicolochytrium jonesii]|uniref:uncharacterized protein n=1 Tax=Fimicolochytrium jonesii TaxID=1396493 RepID=UPI0022FED04D|nr:uncharacterized protein EV422DRAFT_16722 [Fimicolochytrium jonesii]KAI8826897.1 hypothetical protein EV422DRAFT_16722 [Fimicolochytrium jonesii]
MHVTAPTSFRMTDRKDSTAMAALISPEPGAPPYLPYPIPTEFAKLNVAKEGDMSTHAASGSSAKIRGTSPGRQFATPAINPIRTAKLGASVPPAADEPQSASTRSSYSSRASGGSFPYIVRTPSPPVPAPPNRNSGSDQPERLPQIETHPPHHSQQQYHQSHLHQSSPYPPSLSTRSPVPRPEEPQPISPAHLQTQASLHAIDPLPSTATQPLPGLSELRYGPEPLPMTWDRVRLPEIRPTVGAHSPLPSLVNATESYFPASHSHLSSSSSSSQARQHVVESMKIPGDGHDNSHQQRMLGPPEIALTATPGAPSGKSPIGHITTSEDDHQQLRPSDIYDRRQSVDSNRRRSLSSHFTYDDDSDVTDEPSDSRTSPRLSGMILNSSTGEAKRSASPTPMNDAEPGTKQEKLAHKRRMNAEAARRCRERKAQRIQHLEGQVRKLEQSNGELVLRMAMLENERRAWHARESALQQQCVALQSRCDAMELQHGRGEAGRIGILRPAASAQQHAAHILSKVPERTTSVSPAAEGDGMPVFSQGHKRVAPHVNEIVEKQADIHREAGIPVKRRRMGSVE